MRKRPYLWNILVGAIIPLWVAPVCSHAQPFACDGAFYIAKVNSTGSKLIKVFRDEASGAFSEREISLSEPEIKLTCLGFSVHDLYIYAMDFDTYDLLRIESSGKIHRLGVPRNIDTDTYEFHAGEVGPNGRTFTIVGRDKRGDRDRIVYSINLTGPQYSAGILVLHGGNNVSMTDIATDPTSGIRYGFDALQKKIVTIGNAEVSTYAHQALPIMIGSLFFDRSGQLYGYGDPAGGSGGQINLYRFDKNNGKAQKVWESNPSRQTSGCSCPYSIYFEREVFPSVVLPCAEMTIEYRITNHLGVGRLVTFHDELPPEFTITKVEVVNSTLHTILEGVGGHILRIVNLDMQIRGNLIRIKARVEPEAAGIYTMQTFLEGVPLGLGGVLASDDPKTPAPGDPNRVLVSDPQTVQLESVVRFSCDRDTAFIELPIQADRYLWSDGSTLPYLATTENGTFWVEASNDCFFLADTIHIDSRPEALRLDLGGERRMRHGERATLTFAANTDAIRAFQWRVSSGEGLNCLDCRQPVFTASEDVEIWLKIIDENGCAAEDHMRVRVDVIQKVFVPTAFSPNGDGVNDYFFLQGPGGEIRHLRVFDRWGALVFESRGGALNDPQFGWDGKVRGRPAASGVYLFAALVAFPNGEEAAFSGEILLSR